MRTHRAAGYSATPLASKLGIKPSSRVLPVNAPENYAHLLEPLPADVAFENRPGPNIDVAHVFVTRKAELVRHLGAFRTKLGPAAAVWVSWPKKTAGIPSSVTENIIREVALPLGFVDIKVCAVSEIWSGLKLVVRKNLRP